MQLNNELMISVTSQVWLQLSVNGCTDDDFTTAIDDNLNAIEHQSKANLFISSVDENIQKNAYVNVKTFYEMIP